MPAVQNIKKKFPVILERINELVERLHALGPEASVDVDQAALRVTLDVIGLVRLSCDSASVLSHCHTVWAVVEVVWSPTVSLAW